MARFIFRFDRNAPSGKDGFSRQGPLGTGRSGYGNHTSRWRQWFWCREVREQVGRRDLNKLTVEPLLARGPTVGVGKMSKQVDKVCG